VRAGAARLTAALVAVALLLFVDGASKSWAASELRARGPRTIAGGLLRLRYHQNPGFAFLGGRRPPGLTVYSALVAAGLLALLVYRLRQPRAGGLLATAGVVALLAGVGGNLRDRLQRGYVVDFIDGKGPWPFNNVSWPIFNIADAYLAAGMALCLAGLTVATVRGRS
jgi:signal peptidase II